MTSLDIVRVVVGGPRVAARVYRDPAGRIAAARCAYTGDPVPALIDPCADQVAAVRATLRRG